MKLYQRYLGLASQVCIRIPITAHHTLYDCLACQHICPMNSEQKEKIIEDIFFTEEETNMLLEGKSIDSFSADFKSKVYMLGIDQWYEAIPRNLKVLKARFRCLFIT